MSKSGDSDDQSPGWPTSSCRAASPTCGEHYAIAADFEPLRDIVEQWQARLAGHPAFTIRRTETLFDTTDLAQLCVKLLLQCLPGRGHCRLPPMTSQPL